MSAISEDSFVPPSKNVEVR
jgi:hypothetical protein